MAGEVEDKKVRDAAIIGRAQAIEHYEISRYGTLIAWAQELCSMPTSRRNESRFCECWSIPIKKVSTGRGIDH